MTDPRFETAFPHLTADQIGLIEPHAEVITFKDGEYLWHVGDADFAFYIIKSGLAEVVEDSSGAQTHVAFHDAGAFTGDVDLLSGRPSVVSCFAKGECVAIKLTADCLRTIVREHPA